MTLKKLSLLLVALCVLLGLKVPAFADLKTKIKLIIDGASGGGKYNDSTYIFTIPEAITARKIGWNAFTSGIFVKTKEGATLYSNTKLVISADSENGWALVRSPDKSESVSYTLTTQEGGSLVTKFEFSAASVDAGVSQDLGVIISDYTGKTPGIYEDMITFCAEIRSVTTDGIFDFSETSRMVDLSAISGDYEAQTGDILTGIAGSDVCITIAAGATITLKDVTITSIPNDDYHKWAGITPEGDATIILEGTNAVKGGYDDYPGIYAAEGSTLTIKGNGSLTASSGGGGAGIGAGNWESGMHCGNIVIEGGTITATGGEGAAGIGGADIASCGTITITGGTITATGGGGSPGIGAGGETSCGDITISGGTVTATGGWMGAGIGSGGAGACGDITISGGTVTATGGVRAAGIGSGDGGSCGTVTIKSTVTKVTATKGEDGATNSIGAGDDGTCGKVTIEDGANVIQN